MTILSVFSFQSWRPSIMIKKITQTSKILSSRQVWNSIFPCWHIQNGSQKSLQITQKYQEVNKVHWKEEYKHQTCSSHFHFTSNWHFPKQILHNTQTPSKAQIVNSPCSDNHCPPLPTAKAKTLHCSCRENDCTATKAWQTKAVHRSCSDNNGSSSTQTQAQTFHCPCADDHCAPG